MTWLSLQQQWSWSYGSWIYNIICVLSWVLKVSLSSKSSGWKCFVNFWHVYKAVFFKEDTDDFRRFWWIYRI